jgi:hypothetical protein
MPSPSNKKMEFRNSLTSLVGTRKLFREIRGLYCRQMSPTLAADAYRDVHRSAALLPAERVQTEQGIVVSN